MEIALKEEEGELRVDIYIYQVFQSGMLHGHCIDCMCMICPWVMRV